MTRLKLVKRQGKPPTSKDAFPPPKVNKEKKVTSSIIPRMIVGRPPPEGGLEGKILSESILKTNSVLLEKWESDMDIWEFVNRPISKEAFKVLLRYYKNNQDYYLQEKDDLNLFELEQWFIQVVEPPSTPRKEWSLREKFKLENGYTWYSGRDLANKIRQPRYVMKQVKENLINASV